MGPTELIGQVLDERYRVIEPLGEGAMGTVYRGERLKLGRIVAIKVLNETIPNESNRRRFEREAMSMAKLEHPNCGTVLDVGVHEDRPYVVMEFVSGENLTEPIKRGALPVARAIEITRQVLSGLAHAHEHGLIHRDIKPANIMLSQKEGVGDFVKILDFGLARSAKDTANLTGAMVVGTPNYMAPEQICGGEIDHRVDLYACGVLLFELLTGLKPFEGRDPMATCMQHVNVPPPSLAEKAPGRTFGALEAVVARALAKTPAERFSSADEFARALADAGKSADSSAESPTIPLPQERVPAKRSRRVLAIAGGSLVAIAAVAGVILATRSDARSSPSAPPISAAPTPAAPPPPTAPAPSSDPVEELVARALELAGSGRREPALDLLLKARKTYPGDARLPYQASKLYLEKMWWADGLKQARAAIQLDPAYKSDAELIKLVLKGFNTTSSYDWTLARFLRDDIGPAAKPFLEDTATAHPNPIVRKRAAAELKRYK